MEPVLSVYSAIPLGTSRFLKDKTGGAWYEQVGHRGDLIELSTVLVNFVEKFQRNSSTEVKMTNCIS